MGQAIAHLILKLFGVGVVLFCIVAFIEQFRESSKEGRWVMIVVPVLLGALLWSIWMIGDGP